MSARGPVIAVLLGAAVMLCACGEREQPEVELTPEEMEYIRTYGVDEAGEQGTGITYEIAADGFPTGSTSPEGAACDAARALVERDGEMLREASIDAFGSEHQKAAYERALTEAADTLEDEAVAPEGIVRVFDARLPTMAAPRAEMYARYGVLDVRFVDVVLDYGEEERVARTLVARTPEKGWGVVVEPGIYPEISEGLAQESESLIEFGSEDSHYQPGDGD